jgi:hypothetical protein
VWQARERTRRTIDLVAYRLATSPYVQLVIAAVAVGLALSIGHNGPDGLGRMMNALVGTAISIALLYAARRHVRKLRNRLPGVGRETSQLGMFGNLAAAIAH